MRGDLRAAIGPATRREWLRTADLRYAGQSWDIEIDFPGDAIDAGAVAALVARFEAEHERVYGVRDEEGSPVEIRALRLAVLGAAATGTDLRRRTRRATSRRGHDAARRLRRGARRDRDAGRLARRDRRRRRVPGPLLIDEYDTTVVVPPGWTVAARRGRRARRSTARRGGRRAVDDATHADAIVQEIVGNALASIADEMATTIFRTAHSTVVRDVMDFSAALCDPRGETVAQAVTIPLHLGSIPTAMRSLLGRFGDACARRHLRHERPVRRRHAHARHLRRQARLRRGDALIGYAVTVAHHGDVGGRLPGTTRLRQHRGLPGGAPPAVDAAVPGRRAGRGRDPRSSARTCASRA